MEVARPSAAALVGWQALLDPEETAQAGRLRLEADRHGYIAVHALTRRLLEAAGGAPAASWQFRVTEAGKPEIAGPGIGLHFSHAHTDGLVVSAAANFPVGIDAESFARRPLEPGVVGGILAPAEIALVEATAPKTRHETFLRLWTLREAYAKATGKGLHYPREDFWFSLDPARLYLEDGDARKWQVFDWSTKHHVLALAARHPQHDPITLDRRSLAPEEFC